MRKEIDDLREEKEKDDGGDDDDDDDDEAGAGRTVSVILAGLGFVCTILHNLTDCTFPVQTRAPRQDLHSARAERGARQSKAEVQTENPTP